MVLSQLRKTPGLSQFKPKVALSGPLTTQETKCPQQAKRATVDVGYKANVAQ